MPAALRGADQRRHRRVRCVRRPAHLYLSPARRHGLGRRRQHTGHRPRLCLCLPAHLQQHLPLPLRLALQRHPEQPAGALRRAAGKRAWRAGHRRPHRRLYPELRRPLLLGKPGPLLGDALQPEAVRSGRRAVRHLYFADLLQRPVHADAVGKRQPHLPEKEQQLLRRAGGADAGRLPLYGPRCPDIRTGRARRGGSHLLLAADGGQVGRLPGRLFTVPAGPAGGTFLRGNAGYRLGAGL